MPTRSKKREKHRQPILSDDHLELLFAFNEHKVCYLLVGGYAVGFHTEPRTTKDLDIYIRSDEENSRAVFKALASFGAPLAGLGPADFQDGQSWFQMGSPPEQVDILQKLDGVSFDESWAKRVEIVVNPSLTIPVISVEHLIRNKRAAGRLQDLADVQKLDEAEQAKQ